MATATLNPTIDASIEGVNDPDANHGAGGRLEMKVVYAGEEKTYWYRFLANFDASALSSSTINAAQLELYCNAALSADAATLYRCTRPSTWTELGVTGNDYDGVNPWIVAMGDYEVANGEAVTPVGFTTPAIASWQTITGLLEFVTDGIANRSGVVSFLARLDDEDPDLLAGAQYHSRQGGNVPKLVIDHTPVPAARRHRGQVAG